jgi:hypothetical protein
LKGCYYISFSGFRRTEIPLDDENQSVSEPFREQAYTRRFYL